MRTHRFRELVHRLINDEGLQEELRQDPEDFRRRNGLTGEQLDALLEGDESHLVALGAAPDDLRPTSRDKSWFSALLLRTATPVAAALIVLGAALGSSGSVEARGTRTQGKRLGRRRRFGIVVRRAGRLGRYSVYPRARRAIRRHGVRQGFWLRTDARRARFARARAFGVYSDEKSAMEALRQVDPNIGEDLKRADDQIIAK